MSRLLSQVFAAVVAVAIVSSAAPVAAASAPLVARCPASPLSAARPASGGAVIVKYRPWVSPGARALASGASPSARAGLEAPSTSLLTPPPGLSAEEFAALLSVDPTVEYAEPDRVQTLLGGYSSTPNDPAFADKTKWNLDGARYPFGKSWGLRNAGFDVAWPALESDGDRVAYHARSSGASVPIAVLDTGLYRNHPDVGANVVAGGDVFESYSAATGLVGDDDVTPASPWAPGNTEEYAAHGTCVAGEIAAATDNGVGGAGAAWDATVRVYKVAGVWVEGSPADGVPPGGVVVLTSAVVEGIYRAVDDGCKVITMSFGSPYPSQAEQDAIEFASSRGVLVVASSGNDGSAQVLYPAAYDHVLAVGALDMAGLDGSVKRATFSNYGPQLDLLAPGVMIWGLTNPYYDADGTGEVSVPGYTFWNGTSMAAPLVAAAASVVWRLAPDLTAEEVASYLTSGARDLGAPGFDAEHGWGSLDVAASLARVRADYPALGAPAISTASAVASTTVRIAWAPSPGYEVGYEVAVDGSPASAPAAETARTLVLAEGPHRITVTARSPRNWSGPGISAAAVTVTVDLTQPDAPRPSVAQPALTFGDTETGAHSHEYSLDGGAAVSTSAESVSLLRTTAEGTHTVEARVVDAAGNAGPWSSADFWWTAYPATPSLDVRSVTTSGSECSVNWSAVEGAEGYDVRLNAETVRRVTGNGAVFSGLAYGANTLAVRAVRGTVTSDWARLTVRRRAAELSVDRVNGANRYEVSYAISRSTYTSSTTVVLVTGENWPDALSSGVLARAVNAPVLLTRSKRLSPGALAEMRRLGASSVIVVGGEASVAPAVAGALGASGMTVRRIAGPDRYSTAALVAEEIGRLGGGRVSGDTAFVASGLQFPDALIASSAAARTGSPILLTRRQSLPAETARQLSTLGVRRTVVVGNERLIPAQLLSAMPAPVRVCGSTAYETSARFASWSIAEYGSSAGHVFLASAGPTKYGDSLTGGPYVASLSGVLLFVPGELGADASGFIDTNRDDVVATHLLGGEASVFKSVAEQLGSSR